MKKILIFGSICALATPLTAQFVGTNPSIYSLATKIGMGTNSPSFALDLVTGYQSNGIKVTQNTLGSSVLQLNNISDGNGRNWGILSLGRSDAAGSGNFSIYDYTGSNHRLFINGLSGNVGIGTTTPSQKLDVNGNINTTGNITIGAKIFLTETGSLKNTSWNGSGTRLITTDKDGNLSPLSSGQVNQILYGDGTWGNLPGSTFASNGADTYLSTGKLGIGINNPTSALDVNGDIKSSGIITAENGINIGNNILFSSYQSPTSGVGRIYSIGVATGPHGGENDPSACVVGTTAGWFSPAVNTGIVTSADTGPLTPKSFVTMYSSNTTGNGYIDASGSLNGSTPSALYLNQNCHSNTNINLAGGSVNMGDRVFMNKFVQIGSLSGISTGYGNPALTVNMQGGTGIEVMATNANVKAYSVSNVSSYPFSLYGDGHMVISTANNDAFTVMDPANSQLKFKVTKTGQTIINSNGAAATSDLLVITNDPTNINSINTNFKVKANGELYARYIKVTLSNFPDYVFSKNYKLPDLHEVEKFYTQNKHLSDIPSADEVEKNGLDLGEINKLLVKKIEELTIYAVEQNKKTEEQQKILIELQKQIQEIKTEFK